MSPRLKTLAGIVKALGGELMAGGRRALVPGPGHSAADRSVSLVLVAGRVVAHSFAGDDWRDVLDDLRDRGLLAGDGGGPAVGYERPSEEARRAAARELWADGRAIAGTLAERYVRRRGVLRPLPEALRFHRGVPAAVYEDRGQRRPALLAAIQAPDGELAGVEVTYLGADASPARVRTPRKTIGGRPLGSAVRLDPPGETLLVAEGVFSALSASQALDTPAWALLAVGNLAGWSPPEEIRRVLIAGDRGRAGEAGVAKLAGRLRRMGLALELCWPPGAALDWNEAVPGEGGGDEAGQGGPELGDRPSAGPGELP